MRKSKLFIGVLTTVTLIFGCMTTSFADESVVTKTQDKITLTKSAEWTTYNGKSEDENGNKYAKITMKLDTSQAEDVVVTEPQGAEADIVLIMDQSGSMEGQKLTKLKAAASSFIDEMLSIPNGNIRIGLVAFDTNATKRCDLSNDKTTLKNAVNALKSRDLTYIGKGISVANTLMQGSTAPNKFYIMLSDGIDFDEAGAKRELQTAMTNYSGLRTVTIGYDTKEKEEAFLKSLASRNCSGEPFFYTADVQTSSITKSIQDVFNQITKEIKKEVKGDVLVDTIPAEFSIVDGTIQTNDTSLQGILSENKKTISWSWNKEVIQKKVYEMSFISVLDMSKVPESYTKVNTNGTTLDPNANTEGSLTFSYLDTKDAPQTLSLTSPKLNLNKKTAEIKEEKAPAASTPSNEDAANTDETPKTGDNLNTGVIILLGASLLVLVGTTVAKKRRRTF